MDRQPLLSTATATSVVAAIIGVLVAFGLDIDADVQNAILLAVGVIFPLVTAFVARGSVTPTSDPRDDEGRRLVPDVNA